MWGAPTLFFTQGREAGVHSLSATGGGADGLGLLGPVITAGGLRFFTYIFLLSPSIARFSYSCCTYLHSSTPELILHPYLAENWNRKKMVFCLIRYRLGLHGERGKDNRKSKVFRDCISLVILFEFNPSFRVSLIPELTKGSSPRGTELNVLMLLMFHTDN